MASETGPVHAELRIDHTTGDIWTIELAGRSIGGLCSTVLDFGAGISLEELILRHAAGIPSTAPRKKAEAAGVMMIPIPRSGMLRGIKGVTEAMTVPDVTGVEITAPLHQPILALPGRRPVSGIYLCAKHSPEEAEQALRTAHSRLEFEISPDHSAAAGSRVRPDEAAYLRRGGSPPFVGAASGGIHPSGILASAPKKKSSISFRIIFRVSGSAGLSP